MSQILKPHLTAEQVECPLCEAAPNEPCKGTVEGWVHAERYFVADLHEMEVVKTDADTGVTEAQCIECGYVDTW